MTKLKLEHINLTTYSRMRVDLAAQVCTHELCLLFLHVHRSLAVLLPMVLSTTRFLKLGKLRFIRIFDTVFDILNIRHVSEWKQKRKPDLKPFESSHDKRLEVSVWSQEGNWS